MGKMEPLLGLLFKYAKEITYSPYDIDKEFLKFKENKNKMNKMNKDESFKHVNTTKVEFIKNASDKSDALINMKTSFIPGKLYKSRGIIILCTHNGNRCGDFDNSSRFSGVVIKSIKSKEEYSPVGTYSDSWNKEYFKEYKKNTIVKVV